jgi:hypothetical protein
MNTNMNINISDIVRFNRPREWRNLPDSNPTIRINDQQYDWSDNVYGLLSVQNNMFIAVNDRNRLQKTPLLSNDTFGTPDIVSGRRDIILNFFNEPDRSYPAPNYCPDGFFGQGSKADNGFYIPVKSCNNGTNNGTYIQYRNDSGSMGATAGFLANRSINWLAIDPITKFFFIPSNDSTTLSNVSVYDWTPTRYDYRSSTNIISRFVRNIPLFSNNSPFSIQNVTAACFSSNGIFYVLCNNNNNNSGVYAFMLNRDGTRFNLMRFKYIRKQPEALLSFGSDAQSLVGITCKSSQTYNDLYVLYLNKDTGTDNISLIKISNVW